MPIITGSGAKIYIGPAVTEAAADTLAEFEALSYQEIGQVISIGAFGDAANDVSVSILGDARVRHAKGARDAGSMTVTVAHDPLDVGQGATEDAERTNDEYAVKVLWPDAPTGAYSDTLKYFRALVKTQRSSDITNDGVLQKTYEFGINSEIFTDEAAIST
jgi:hypothetical protein